MRCFTLVWILFALLADLAWSAAPAPGYLNYTGIVARLHEVAAKHPDIAQVVNLNQLLQTPLTAEGRLLWALKISDHVAASEDEPAVIVDGCHHARELVTPYAVLDIAEVLTAEYGVDPVATKWVDHYEIWLIPCVNPDGLTYVFNRDRNWRKNRTPMSDGSFGVDLNRNYPFMWGACGDNSRAANSEIYRGPAPGSEPEIRTMLALGARTRPMFYLSYHSFGQTVLAPYVCGQLAERRLVDSIRDQYVSAIDYKLARAASSGESFEHFYNQYGAISFLTEIGTEFQPPFTQIANILRRLRPGWRFILDRGLGPSIQGHVRKAATGKPLPEAMISIDGIKFTEGEIREPEAQFGRYQWLLLPGTYTITYTAPGFQSQSRTVTVTGEAVSLDVDLAPLAAGIKPESNPPSRDQ
jgi:hypothetical protein